MRYYRTTGLMITQMQELTRRVKEELREPWNKLTGRPKSLGLYKAAEAACMYIRQNATQEFIGDMRDTSQPTISRYVKGNWSGRWDRCGVIRRWRASRAGLR